MNSIDDLEAITVHADIMPDNASSDAAAEAEAHADAIRRSLGAFFGESVRVDVIASATESISMQFGGVSTGRDDAVLLGHARSLVAIAGAIV